MSEHQEISENLKKAYEEDIINFRGILYFGLGLFLLIVITFGLMWYFQYQFLEVEQAKEDQKNENPMAENAGDKQERLKSGMRLQSAPGFGVQDPKGGWKNLELTQPQAEYRELLKQWEDQWKNGEKVIDQETKKETVVSLSIEEAKERFLADKDIKAKSGIEGEQALQEARSMVSASSAGRTRSDIKR